MTGTLHALLVQVLQLGLTSVCHQALASRDVAADGRAEKQLVALLTIPLESYDVVTVLGLGRYPALMALLQLSMRKEMAVKIVQSILKNDTKVREQSSCALRCFCWWTVVPLSAYYTAYTLRVTH